MFQMPAGTDPMQADFNFDAFRAYLNQSECLLPTVPNVPLGGLNLFNYGTNLNLPANMRMPWPQDERLWQREGQGMQEMALRLWAEDALKKHYGLSNLIPPF